MATHLIDNLKAYRAGDEAAGYELLQSSQMQNIIGRECWRYVDSHDIEDLKQECYLIILSKLTRFTISDNPSDGQIINFVNKILPNSLFNSLNLVKEYSLDETNEDEQSDSYVSRDKYNYLESDELSPEDSYIENETRGELIYSISSLTDRQKTVIDMYYYKNKTQEEIAAALNISQVAVHKILQRALTTLRKKLTTE